MRKKAQIKKGYEKYVLISLIFFYFLTRLVNLSKLPIFNDEATYLDWSYRMINFKGEFYHSVYHAKPPLFMWVVGLARKLISDPLLAGRVMSVITGFLTALGLYKISKEIFNQKTAYLAFFLYIIIPIFVFFDRQALMESSVAASGVWSFYFFLKLKKSYQYKYSFLLGTVLGLGYLVKTSAIVFLLAIIALLVFEVFRNRDKLNLIINALITLLIVYAVTLSPLILHQAFWQTLKDNRRYIFTISEIIKFPLDKWFINLGNFLNILIIYLNPLILIAGIGAIYLNLKKKRAEVLLAVIFLLVGSAFVIFIDKLTIVRHTVVFLPIFVIFPAYLFIHLIEKAKMWGNLVVAASIIPAIIITTLLIFSPIRYFNLLDSITKHSQESDYVTYWSSGYGFGEVKDYLEELSENQVIVVGVRLDAGIPENAVFAYFIDSDQVLPTYLDSRFIKNFASYECLKSNFPLYYVSRGHHLGGLDNYFIEIKRVYKPEGKHYIGIHRLKTDCEGKTLQIM